MHKKIIIVFALAVCFLAFLETKAQSLLQSGEIPKDLIITLERSPCVGACPDYKLTIKFDGTVMFDGGNFTRTKGKATGKISQEQIKHLITEFETIGFFNLRNTYVSSKDGCKGTWHDGAGESILIQINGQKKQILHNFGCQGVDGNPTEIVEKLGVKIDEITNSKIWIEPVKTYEEFINNLPYNKSKKKKAVRKKP